ESKPIKYPMSKIFYSLSKKKAHQLVNDSSDKLNIINVCPSFMIGSYDTKPSSGKIILMGLKKVIFCPPGGKNFINVKDAANGVISALKNGERGQSYILSNENLSYKEFFKKVINLSKSKSFIVPIPKAIFFLGGIFGEVLRFFKIKTSISIANLNALTVKTYFTNAKAKKELKIDFNPIEEGISEAIQWFKSNSIK
ncbi:MAG: dihydroflavonol 4-reductase, partial [Parvicellaceae bacterium]